MTKSKIMYKIISRNKFLFETLGLLFRTSSNTRVILVLISSDSGAAVC